MCYFQADSDDNGDDGDDDDDEGWITPENIEAMKKASLAMNQHQITSVPVACITTDYAMQVDSDFIYCYRSRGAECILDFFSTIGLFNFGKTELFKIHFLRACELTGDSHINKFFVGRPDYAVGLW